MSTSNTNTKLNDLCDDLEGCKLGKISDEELFKEPPYPLGDCPICFLRMPFLEYIYQTCCGKEICNGCVFSPLYDNQGNEVDNKKCAFCRLPTPDTDEEAMERLRKRIEADDPLAMFYLGCYYDEGIYGYPQDYTKALEYWHRAAEELGHAAAHSNIGLAYVNGRGVDVDKEKAKHYYELAAILGDATARYHLGNNERKAGSIDRAIKHYMIAVRGGDSKSLKQIKQMYTYRHATKDDYTKALRSYQEYLGEIKSKQRDTVAATYEHCRYY